MIDHGSSGVPSRSVCRPKQHLEAAGKRYPQAWKLIDAMRADRGRGLPEWPEWCFAPLAGSAAVINERLSRAEMIHHIGDIGRLAALAAWRVSQGVYCFDPEVYAAVRSTPLSGDLPCDVLFRLPEWCVYVETPGITFSGGPLHGFFAHLEWDPRDGRAELRLLLDLEGVLLPAPLHLGPWSLDEALRRVIQAGIEESRTHGFLKPEVTALPQGGPPAASEYAPLISLLLYLCALNAEIGDGRRQPERPQPKRTKRGERLFPPDRPTVWDVGLRLGAALRQAGVLGTENAPNDVIGRARGPVRPHIRRAHWHTYRVGPGKADARLKWLPPILVNIADPEALPVTVRIVGGGG